MTNKFLNDSTVLEDKYKMVQIGELLANTQYQGTVGVMQIFGIEIDQIEFKLVPSAVNIKPTIKLLQPYKHLEGNKKYQIEYKGWEIKNEFKSDYYDGFCVVGEDVLFLMYFPVITKFKVPESYSLVQYDQIIDTTYHTGQKGYITLNDEQELPIEVLILFPSIKDYTIELQIIGPNKYFRANQKIILYPFTLDNDQPYSWGLKINNEVRLLQLFLPRSVL